MKEITICERGTSLCLPGYGVNGTETYVMVDQVAQFGHISYNGLHGTAVKLVCGQEVRSECWPQDLARALCAANAVRESCAETMGKEG